MPDNVNITVNETIENVVINPSISTDVIDVNTYSTTENVNIAVTPELTTININSVTSVSPVTSVNGQIGDVVIPTSDNNFTTVLKNKLDGIQAGAEVNVNSDWNATSGDAQILNKPTIPSITNLVPYTGATTDVNLGTKDIYLEKVFLNDAVNGGYASIHYSDSDFHIEDADGHKLLVIEDGFVQLHKTDTIQSNLFTQNLTQTRDHYLPNQSGIIALTSDIPAPITIDTTPTDGSANAVSSNGVFDSLATKFTLPSLTSGSVLFSNGTTIAEDNANFFWDNTNKRLGIGKTTPLYLLDVNNSIGINTDAVGKGIFAYSGPAQMFSITRQSVSVNGSTSITSYGDIGFSSNKVGGASTAYDMMIKSGTVLIGTTTDNGGKLQIKAGGALSTDIALRVRNSSDTADLMTVNGIGGGLLNSITLLGESGTTVGVWFGSGGSSGRITIDGAFTRWKSQSQADMINVANNFVGINSTSVIASAVLAVDSTTRGFLPPRMTTTQKNAIASPETGLIVYDTTLQSLSNYNGTNWIVIGAVDDLQISLISQVYS
jgi:hypothetical protein